ncbi:MAG: glycosyltransferase [Bacteroidia bacterium]|nr:glycosyltransferase [Bacteroidia bacterium]
MKRKILFVIESLGGGGAEKVLSTIVKHIDKERFDVTVCPIVGTGPYVEDIKKYANYRPILRDKASLSPIGRIWYAIKYKLIYNILPLSWVYKLWIPKGYDTEIAFCEGFATKLMSTSTNKKAQKIAWVHTDLKINPWTQEMGIFKNISEETKAYSHFGKIITVSKSVEQSFSDVYGQNNKICTIYNPIDSEEIITKSNISSLGKDNKYRKQLNIITIGRLVHLKGYDILVRIVKRLLDEGYKLHLDILGEGDERAKLESYITNNNLANNITLLGFQKNPYQYIANSDLFVCSSRSEGYSLVIAEALVLGVPVISTYCSGPNELLNEGEYGMLVENNEDGEGLYNGIKKLLDDRELLSKYQEKAITRGSTFGVSSIMNKIESII